MRIIKNHKIIFLILFVVAFFFCKRISAAIYIPQSIREASMRTFGSISIEFSNETDPVSGSLKSNYKIKDSDGGVFDGTSYGCMYIDSVGNFKDGGVLFTTNGAIISTICNSLPEGDYQICVKDVKSIGSTVGMPEQCVDITNRLIVEKVDFSNSGPNSYDFPDNRDEDNIRIITNGVFNDDESINSATYIFKDKFGQNLNGQNILCYGSQSEHPLINSNGELLGDAEISVYNQNSININIGCSLPENDYKVCISNLFDDYSGIDQNSQDCVDFNPAPKVLDVKTFKGDKAIKVFFDNDLYNINKNNIIFKDLDNNPIKLNDNIDKNGHPDSVFYSQKFCNAFNPYENYYVDNISGCDGYNTLVLDFDISLADTEIDEKYQYKYVFPSGTYKACFSDIRAGAAGFVPMSEQCMEFTIGEGNDLTSPVLYHNSDGLMFNKNIFPSKNKIFIKYYERMGDSAINSENYMIKDFDDNGDNYVNVTEWTKLSDIPGVIITFKNNNKDVLISLPNSVSLVEDNSDFMIGSDIDSIYTIYDYFNNPFVETTNNYNFVYINDLLLNNNVDISKFSTIKKINIESSTQLKVTFDRDIDTVSKEDFIIKNTSNRSGIIPVSAEIDSVNKNTVIFTIPSGSSNAFTIDDTGDNRKNIQLITSENVLGTRDIYGFLFESGRTFYVSSDNIYFSNSLIKPYIKSVKLEYPYSNLVLIEIAGGEIDTSYDNLSSLADSLFIYQTVNNQQRMANGWTDDFLDEKMPSGKIYFWYDGYDEYNNWYNYENYYDPVVNSTYLYAKIGISIDKSIPFYIKTAPGVNGYLNNVVDNNGSYLKVNTAGISSLGNIFFTKNNKNGLVFEESNNIDAGTYFSLVFNKKIDLNSISSNLWKKYKGGLNIDPIDSISGLKSCNKIISNCYTKKIKNGVVFDSLSNKIYFPGTNIGEIYDLDGFTIRNDSSVSISDLVMIYNTFENTLFLILEDNIDVEVNTGDLMRFFPNNNIKTISGEYINTLNYLNLSFISEQSLSEK